jgi:hypothetical protein
MRDDWLGLSKKATTTYQLRTPADAHIEVSNVQEGPIGLSTDPLGIQDHSLMLRTPLAKLPDLDSKADDKI